MNAKGIMVLFVIAILFIGPTLVLNDFDSPTEEPAHGMSDVNKFEGAPPKITIDQVSNLGPYFIENLGQKGEGAGKYYSQGEPLSVAFGIGWVAYHLRSDEGPGVLFRVTFPGSDEVEPLGELATSHATNIFLGDNPEHWYSQVGNYKRVRYSDLWDGVDLVFYFNNGMLKYDLLVKAGKDHSQIQFQYEGADYLEIEEMSGDLLIHTPLGILREEAPLSFQQGIDGILPSSFQMIARDVIGFSVVDVDRSLPLTIDPGMNFNTFFGGSSREYAESINIDSSGCAYITGWTYSRDFPTTSGAYDTTTNEYPDAFVFKLNANGTSLEYSTYIGGSKDEWGTAIRVDDKDCVFVTGYTESSDFPTSSGAYDNTTNGRDVFVIKLNETGSSIIYSTLVGGSGGEVANDMSIDASGCAFITGTTDSSDFPTTLGAFQDEMLWSASDVFVVKLDSTGSSLIFSTYIGGTYEDFGEGLCIDDSGNVYVTGRTYSSDFPTTSGAYDTTHNGGTTDIFVLKLNATGSALHYSTFIGGNSGEHAWSICIDGNGSSYVTGMTGSQDFPTTQGAYDTTYGGINEGFILKVNATGSSLEFSTYIGGSSSDSGYDITVDDSASIYVTGTTESSDFPTTPQTYDSTSNGGADGFFLKFNDNGTKLRYSSYLGGTKADFGKEICIENSTYAYITGYTGSSNFPTTSGAHDTTLDGEYDGFVAKIQIALPPDVILDSTPKEATTGDPFTFNVTVIDNDDVSNVSIEYWYGNSSSHFNQSLNRISGTPESGTWAGTIMIPSDSIERLHYTIYAEDVLGFNNRTSARNVTVLDNDLPIFIKNLSESNGTTGDDYTFSVNVSDNLPIGNQSVYLNYAFDRGPYTNVSMAWINPTDPYWGVFSYDVTMPMYTLSRVAYYFTMMDEAGNWNTSTSYSFTVVDNDPAFLGPDLSDTRGTTGDVFHLEVEVYDNIEVGPVHVVYWFKGDTPTNVTMPGTTVDPDGNGTYEYFQLTVPSNSLDRLQYYFAVADAAGNWNNTTQKDIEVFDNDPAILVSDDSDAFGTTGVWFDVKANVSDNIGVSRVHMVYWKGNEPTPHLNQTMTGVDISGTGNGSYSSFIRVVFDSRGPIHYYFAIKDVSGLWNITGQVTVPVIDNFLPEFRDEVSPNETTTGDMRRFQIHVFDNWNLSEVRCIYWFGNGSVTNDTMVLDNPTVGENGDFVLDALIPSDINDTMFYYFFAMDTSGNWNTTITFNSTVWDNDLPTLVEDLSDEVPTTGDVFWISVRLEDNVGIESAEIVCWYSMNEYFKNNYTMKTDQVPGARVITFYTDEIVMLPDYLDIFDYYVVFYDTSGNMNRTRTYRKDIVDDDRPWLVLDTTPVETLQGHNLTFSFILEDNLNVDQAFVEYWYTYGSVERRENLTLEETENWSATISIPRFPDTHLTYFVSFADWSGNWNITIEREVALLNPPPTIDPILDWHVVEGVEVELDVTGYVSDQNDPHSFLALFCENRDVEVDGMVLIGSFDIWTPDLVIEIEITDGQYTAFTNITVVMTNVNDPPVITSSPLNIGMVGKEYRYQIEYTDEDDVNDHFFTLVSGPERLVLSDSGLILWTPSRSQHDQQQVSISVSDGTDTVYQNWTILVIVGVEEPDNRPPYFVGRPNRHAVAGTLFECDIDAEDHDNDTLYYHLNSGPDGSTIDIRTGMIRWLPPIIGEGESKSYVFTVEVTDGVNTVPLEFTVRSRNPPDQPPVIKGKIPDLVIDGRYVLDLSKYMSDPDDPADQLSWRVEGPGWQDIDVTIEGNKLIIVPTGDRTGPEPVTLVLEDASGLEDRQKIEVTVEDWKDKLCGWPLIILVLVIVVVMAVVVSRRRRTLPTEPVTTDIVEEGTEVSETAQEETDYQEPPADEEEPVVPGELEDLEDVDEADEVEEEDMPIEPPVETEEAEPDLELEDVDEVDEVEEEEATIEEPMDIEEEPPEPEVEAEVAIAALAAADLEEEEIDPVEETVEEAVDVTLEALVSAVTTIGTSGGFVRLLVVVQNPTEGTIHNVSLSVDYDKALAELDHVEEDIIGILGNKVIIGNIEGNESREIALLFNPLDEGTLVIKGDLKYTTDDGESKKLDIGVLDCDL